MNGAETWWMSVCSNAGPANVVVDEKCISANYNTSLGPVWRQATWPRFQHMKRRKQPQTLETLQNGLAHLPLQQGMG